MTREEATRIIKKCKEKGFRNTFYTLEEYYTALDMAIEALEQEPKTDTWSIKDVADTLAKHGIMRDATPEEQKSVNDYIKSISTTTGVKFDDAISRQAVEELIKAEMPERGMWEIEGDKEKETVCEVCVDLMQELSELPPVNPQQKTGHWIKVTNGRGGHECDVCHDYAPSYMNGDEHLSAFCPNCGAKMQEVEE